MDAEQLPWRRAVNPVEVEHAAVWIRVGGHWLHGTVQHQELIEGRWAVWLQHEDPSGGPWACWGLFRFDPAVIRRRDGGDRPEP